MLLEQLENRLDNENLTFEKYMFLWTWILKRFFFRQDPLSAVQLVFCGLENLHGKIASCKKSEQLFYSILEHPHFRSRYYSLFFINWFKLKNTRIFRHSLDGNKSRYQLAPISFQTSGATHTTQLAHLLFITNLKCNSALVPFPFLGTAD